MNLHKLLYRILKMFSCLDMRINYINSLPRNCKLLDIGCGNGNVLRRFQAVRPDIKITGVDREDIKELLPGNVNFYKLDLESDSLPFPDNCFTGVTMVHVVEHIRNPEKVFKEIFRVLQDRGHFYLETPHVKSLYLPAIKIFPDREGGPVNFYDDPTHVTLYRKEDIRNILINQKIADCKFGIYRNYIYMLISPLLMFYGFILMKRQWFVVGLHHLLGWSMYCRGRKR